MKTNYILQGDCVLQMQNISTGSVDCVITSPPYWQLRDYGYPEQWGLEPTFKEYLAHLQSLMKEIWRVLKPTGTVWINLGDTYNSNSGGYYDKSDKFQGKTDKSRFKNEKQDKNVPAKSLMQIPARFAIDCTDNGWILRNDIIWAKPNGMPESVTDRFSKKHEHIYFFVKQGKYYFDLDSVRQKPVSFGKTIDRKSNDTNFNNNRIKAGNNPLGKNCGDVTDFWAIPTKPSSSAHYASYNLDLIKIPILAGCPENGTILDPFFGTGTTGYAAIKYNRNFIGIEHSQKYIDIANKRLEPYLQQKDLF